MVVTVLLIYGVHDDWQRLLLSSSSFIRLHLFLSYCVCLPLNLTRQRDSSTLEAQPRTGNWFPKERKRKNLYHCQGKMIQSSWHDDSLMLVWLLLLNFCLFSSSSSDLNWRSFQVDFYLLLFYPNLSKNKIRPPLRFLVVGCRFSFLQLTSSPLFWKLKKKRR